MSRIKPKIKYVEYGLAACFKYKKERWIELNKSLKKYPKLHKELLKHELDHYYSKKKFDFMIDMKEMLRFKNYIEIYIFCMKHPKTFTNLIPITWNKKGFSPNYFSLIQYVVFVVLLVILIKI